MQKRNNIEPYKADERTEGNMRDEEKEAKVRE